MTKFTGGCLCGGVRFVADGAPRRVGVCHCASCRKATGGAFSVYVDFVRDAVVFDRAPAVFRSSRGVERLFCANCGAALAYRGDGSADEINLHLGAFDAPAAFAPNAVSFEADGLTWARAALAALHLENYG